MQKYNFFDLKIVQNITLFVILLFFYLFANYGMPLTLNSDEVVQLKNIYAMISNKSLLLQYDSAYSIWVHYIYLLPTVIYWIFKYFLLNFSTISEFQLYVLNNYHEVLPFLRVYTATIFFVGLLLIRNMLSILFNSLTAYLFLILLGLNLLVIINVHYSKHWMADFGMLMISIYFYFKYLNINSYKYLFLSAFLFGFAILSNSALIFFSFYYPLLAIYIKQNSKKIVIDGSYFIILFLCMFFLTKILGTGGLSDYATSIISSSYLPRVDSLWFHLVSQFDYNIFQFLFFVVSIFILIKIKKFQYLFLLAPYFLYWFVISYFHYEPRYSIFLIFGASLFSAIVIGYIDNKRYLFYIMIIYLIFSMFLSTLWLYKIAHIDTRLEAKNFVEQNLTSKDFIIYDVITFSYLPLTTESISLTKELAPNAISTRDELHLSYKLKDGHHGIVLRKFEQAGYDIEDFTKELINRGYNPIIVHERFGKIAMHYEGATNSFNILKSKFNLKQIQEFDPIINKDADREKIGDILINFNYVLYTLFSVKQSGPVISIYKVQK